MDYYNDIRYWDYISRGLNFMWIKFRMQSPCEICEILSHKIPKWKIREPKSPRKLIN